MPLMKIHKIDKFKYSLSNIVHQRGDSSIIDDALQGGPAVLRPVLQGAVCSALCKMPRLHYIGDFHNQYCHHRYQNQHYLHLHQHQHCHHHHQQKLIDLYH